MPTSTGNNIIASVSFDAENFARMEMRMRALGIKNRSQYVNSLIRNDANEKTGDRPLEVQVLTPIQEFNTPIIERDKPSASRARRSKRGQHQT